VLETSGSIAARAALECVTGLWPQSLLVMAVATDAVAYIQLRLLAKGCSYKTHPVLVQPANV